MTEIIGIIITLLIAAIGFVVIASFRLLPKTPFLLSISYGYGLGFGLVGIHMFLLSRLGVAWHELALLIPWLVLAVYLLLARNLKKVRVKIPRVGSGISLVLIVIILSLIFYVIFEALLRPLTAWDGWASWLLKSRVFYIDGGIRDGVLRYVQSDYPLVVGLVGTFFYTLLGQINDRVVLLLSAGFYIATGGIFFFSLKNKIGIKLSLLFTFLLFATQNLIRHGGRYEAGQADLALGYFFLADTVLLSRYIKDKKISTLVLLNLFVGITGLIKNEGILFSLLIESILLWIIIAQKRFHHMIGLVPFVILFLDWQLYRLFSNMPKVSHYISASIHPERLSIIITEFVRQMINVQNWNLVWIAYMLACITWAFGSGRKNSAWIFLLLSISQLLVYVGVFMVTNTDTIGHIRGVFDRLLIHLAPIAIFFTALVVGGLKGHVPKLFNILYEKV
jgi:hypothetical protein